MTLTVSGGAAVSLAHRRIQSAEAGLPVRVALQLARGRQPLSITDTCRPSQPLSLAVEHAGVARLILTRDLRPDGVDEGLLAVYQGSDQQVHTTIEPLLDFIAVEDLLFAPKDVPVRRPFTANWNGLLQVLAGGAYEFEAEDSGAYVVTLDGETLLEQAHQESGELHPTLARRLLAAGPHPLTARWENAGGGGMSHLHLAGT